jgi:integrase
MTELVELQRGRCPWCGDYLPDPRRRCAIDHIIPTVLAESIPITDVSRWLGHKSIEVIQQIYGHLIPPPSTAHAPRLTRRTRESRRLSA